MNKYRYMEFHMHPVYICISYVIYVFISGWIASFMSVFLSERVFSLWPPTSWGGRSQNNDYKRGTSCVVCTLNYTFYYIQNTVEPLQRVSQIHFRSCEFLQAATCSTVVSNVYDEAERQQGAGSHAHLLKQNQCCWWKEARKQEEEKNKGGRGGGGRVQTVRRPRSENGRKARGSECEWPEMWERDEMRQGRKQRESWAEVEEMRGRKDVCHQRRTLKWREPSLDNRSLLTVLSRGGLTCSQATEEWSRILKSWWFRMNLGQRNLKPIFSGDLSAPAWVWSLWLRIIYSISCL